MVVSVPTIDGIQPRDVLHIVITYESLAADGGSTAEFAGLSKFLGRSLIQVAGNTVLEQSVRSDVPLEG